MDKEELKVLANKLMFTMDESEYENKDALETFFKDNIKYPFFNVERDRNRNHHGGRDIKAAHYRFFYNPKYTTLESYILLDITFQNNSLSGKPCAVAHHPAIDQLHGVASAAADRHAIRDQTVFGGRLVVRPRGENAAAEVRNVVLVVILVRPHFVGMAVSHRQVLDFGVIAGENHAAKRVRPAAV